MADHSKKRLLIIVIVLLILAFFLLRPIRHKVCRRDSDCQSGLKCTDDGCVECESNSDCMLGQNCVEGSCVAFLPPVECESNSDCMLGQNCVEGSCVAFLPTFDNCTEDSDCEDGTCHDGNCYDNCTGDDDCAQGTLCILGICIPSSDILPNSGYTPCDNVTPCATNTLCIDGACVPSEGCTSDCRNDTYCSDDMLCNDTGACFTCSDVNSCEVNSDCPTGQFCDTDVCMGCIDTYDVQTPANAFGVTTNMSVCSRSEIVNDIIFKGSFTNTISITSTSPFLVIQQDGPITYQQVSLFVPAQMDGADITLNVTLANPYSIFIASSTPIPANSTVTFV